MTNLNIKWIPTSEKLPYTNDEVIISTIYNTVCLATYRYYPGFSYWAATPCYYYDTDCTHKKICYNIHNIDSDNSYQLSEVIAWMPAPEPYKYIHYE